MKKALFLIILLFPSSGINAQTEKIIETDSTYIVYHINKQGVKHGKYEVYADSDRDFLIESGTYTDGEKTGVWEYYSIYDWNIYNTDSEIIEFMPDIMQFTVNYTDGIQEGKCSFGFGKFSGKKDKFINKHIICEGNYNNDSTDGEWFLYKIDYFKKKGDIHAYCKFDKGKKLSPWKIYKDFEQDFIVLPVYDFLEDVEIKEINPDKSFSLGYYNKLIKKGSWKVYTKNNEFIRTDSYDRSGQLIPDSIQTAEKEKEINKVQLLFRHPELYKPHTINFSKNNKYVVISDNDPGNYAIIYAVYSTHNPVLVSSRKVSVPKVNLSVDGISNDGRYLFIFDFDSQSYVGAFDTYTDNYIFDKAELKLKNPDFEEDFDPVSWDYFIDFEGSQVKFTHQYIDEEFYIDSIYDCKPINWGEIQISPDKKYVAIQHKKKIRIFDTQTKELLWESPEQPIINFCSNFRLFNNGVILTNKVCNDHKDMHVYWYDFLNDRILFSTNSQAFASIAAYYQIYNYVFLGYDSKKNYDFNKIALIDLSDCRSSISEYKKLKREDFDFFTDQYKDSLRSIYPKKISHLNKNAEYKKYWDFLYSKYFNYDGSLRKEPGFDTAFFTDFGIFEHCYEAKTAFEDIRHIVYYALDQHVTLKVEDGNGLIPGLLPPWHVNKEILFWNGEKKVSERTVKMLYSLNAGPFFYTDDLYYFGSKELTDLISFSKGGNTYQFEQFDLKYNRPDIILDRLGFADSTLIYAYHNAYLKRLQKMGFKEEDLGEDFHIPETEIMNFEYMPVIDQQDIELDLNFEDSEYKLDRYNIWINDVPIFGVKGRNLKDKQVNSFSVQETICLNRGMNKIQVSCLNEKGAESYKETVEIIYNPKEASKPDLYVISIGVSEYSNTGYNLTYADKDAENVADLFAGNKNMFKNIYVTKLLNKDATAENILKLKDQLQNTKVDDQVIVFFAGHGLLDSFDYYLGTTETDAYNLSETALAYEDFEALLDGIPARYKLVLLDACHSGEVDDNKFVPREEKIINENNCSVSYIGKTRDALRNKTSLSYNDSFELMKELFADLRRGTGSMIISSAGGGEFAIEGEMMKNGKIEKISNGIFTYSLIEALKNRKADSNNDGNITVSELKAYVFDNVSRLSAGYQNPTSRTENLELDFVVW